jgi:uncharacterized protein involved in exopolysaccharide biosynthesis
MPEKENNSDDNVNYKSEFSKEDEINLLEYWRVIWKRRKLIGYIVAATVVLTAVYSLTMTNIYQARAVITPVGAKDGGGGGLAASLAQQFGGLPGIAMPGSSSATEIVNLLKSNILREKVIAQHNLMPVLFSSQWDAKQQRWKASEGGFSLNPLVWVSSLIKLVTPAPTPTADARKKQPGVPDTWDGLRALDGIVKVNSNIKEGTIVITADYSDPDLAAKFVEYFMISLTDHMSSEARRVAQINMKYLEGQLGATADPFIKQKIYNLIAQQIETSMMAEVKENFAFKITDPPKAPDMKIKPKRAQMVMIAFIMALFMGVFVAFFLEYLEKQNIMKSLKNI